MIGNKSEHLIAGLSIGGFVGVIAGIAIATFGTGEVATVPDGPGSKDGSAKASAVSSQLLVDVGRGHRSSRWTMFPVRLTNNGSDLSYAKVTCELFDAKGEFIASAFTNWQDVPAGGTVSGEVSSDVVGVESATCRGSTR